MGTQSNDGLKPCPWCGFGEVVLGAKPSGIKEHDELKWKSCGICRRCLTPGPTGFGATKDEARGEAARRWNKRAAEATCHWVPFENGHSMAGPGWRCSNCGLELGPENAFVVDRCYCCPGCQAKAVDE